MEMSVHGVKTSWTRGTVGRCYSVTSAAAAALAVKKVIAQKENDQKELV